MFDHLEETHVTVLTVDDAQQMLGTTLLDPDGGKLGKVSDVYMDSATDTPEWALVHTGMFGGRESFVPLAQARKAGSGVQVPYSKEQVKGAPTAEPDGELSQDEEAQLYAHYGLDYSEAPSGSGLPTAGVPAPAPKRKKSKQNPMPDDAMTRSEEHLTVGMVQKPSQTVRLRKRIVTENASVTVPVTRERATVTREPITDANRAKAMDGPEITEAEHEITLTAERAVAHAEAVPVERIKVGKRTVTEQQTVSGEVRKEVIETEGVTDTRSS